MLTIQQYAKGASIPQNYLANAQLTVNIVNDIFNQFPNQFTFNSGYRTPERNRAVGGTANSYHIKALAADITPRNGNYNQYKPALERIVGKYGWELVDERRKNHFHIEPLGKVPVPVTNELLDIGTIATVDIRIPKDDGDFIDSIAQTFDVSRQTAIAGCALLGLIILTRI